MKITLQKALALVLIFSLAFCGSPLTAWRSSFCLAPQSVLEDGAEVAPLTPIQEVLLKEVFLNPGLGDTLDRIVAIVAENYADRVDAEMTFLSEALYSEDELESVLIKRKPEPTARVRREGKKRRHRIRTLEDWLNASVTIHLSREIRQREITYRNKRHLEGKWTSDIEKGLNEMREVLPTEGIQGYVKKGTYLLVYKEFVLLLYGKKPPEKEDFPKLFEDGEIVFEYKSKLGGNLTVFRLPSVKDRRQICHDWKTWELPDEPPERMVHTLTRFKQFVTLTEQTLRKVDQDLEVLERWAKQEPSPFAGESAPQGKKEESKNGKDSFVENLRKLRDQIRSIQEVSNQFLKMPERKIGEVSLKNKTGVELEAQVRKFSRTILSELMPSEGDLFIEESHDETVKGIIFHYLNLDQVVADLRLENKEQARKEIQKIVISLDKEIQDLIRRMSKLGRVTEPVKESVTELIQGIVRDYQGTAREKGVELEIRAPARADISLTTLPLELELILYQMTSKAVETISKREASPAEDGYVKKVVFRIERERGEGAVLIHVEPKLEKNGQTTVSLSSARRRRIPPSGLTPVSLDGLDLTQMISRIGGRISVLADGAQTLRLPQQMPMDERTPVRIRSEEGLVSLPTLSPKEFRQAQSQYLFEISREKFLSLLPKQLKQELIALNKMGDLSLQHIATIQGKGVEELVDGILRLACLEPRTPNPIQAGSTLRQVADETGLRLSQIVSLLKIPKRTEKEPSDIPLVTMDIRRTSDGEDKINENLEKISFSGESLIVLRLRTEDPAGNKVEQIVVDRLSRLKQCAHTLGTSSSFNKFLFNARRTFDRHAREIIFDEFDIDPQSQGFGRNFHQNQLKAFIEAGFAVRTGEKRKHNWRGVRLREDTVSLVTLNWFEGAYIDWERLAFKEHWLQSMKGLFEALGISLKGEAVTTERLRKALWKEKVASQSFEKFLNLIFNPDNSEEGRERVNKIKDSREEGFLEFLKLRLVGYGRRKVTVEKIRAALEALPEECQEKREDGIAVLEDEKSDFWKKRVPAALNKLEEGQRKAGISGDPPLPNFSRGSPERLQAYQYAERLLQEHEFSLCLVGNLSPQLAAGGSVDYMKALTQMRPDFIATGVTKTPSFVELFRNLDKEWKRYLNFWKNEWEEPNLFFQRAAERFERNISEADLEVPPVIASRIFYPQVCHLFFSDPVTQEMLKQRDGILGVSYFLQALFSLDPQLAGIILRNSQQNFGLAKEVLSKFPKTMIAKILDLETAPLPKGYRFSSVDAAPTDLDPTCLLRLLTPNDSPDPQYAARVKEIIQEVQPRTLAILLQYSHACYKSNPYEGWVKWVFLAALQGMENEEQFLQALKILKGKEKGELNDPEAADWVKNIFETLSAKKERKTIDEWLTDAHPHKGQALELLGRRYSPVIYRDFMYYFGYTDFATSTQSHVDTQRQDAADVLSEIWKIDSEMAGIIVRSTQNSEHDLMLQILLGMPHENFVGILDQELSSEDKPRFVPWLEKGNFGKRDHFIALIFLRAMLLKSKQDNTNISPVRVRAILNMLKPASLAALVQYLRLNVDNQQFQGIADDLREVKEHLDQMDPSKWEKVMAFLNRYDEEMDQAELSDREKKKAKVCRWVTKVLEGENEADSFVGQLRENYPWVHQKYPTAQEGVLPKLKEFLLLLEKSSGAAFMDREDSEIIFILRKIIAFLESGKDINEAFLSYAEFKMRIRGILDKLDKFVRGYEEDPLTEEQKILFLFRIFEPEGDAFFQQVFQEKGLSGFKAVTPGKLTLKVKLIRNAKNEPSRFGGFRKGDLVVTDVFVQNDSSAKQPGGILLGVPYSVNGHAYEWAKALNIPCAFLPCAQEIFQSLVAEADEAGQEVIVVFDVGRETASLCLASEEERKGFYANPARDAEVDAFSRLRLPEVCVGEGEPLVMNLNEIIPGDRKRVGPKAERLAKAKQAKMEKEDTLLLVFPVPDGFCVTNKGYQSFLEFNGIENEIKELLGDIDKQDEIEMRRRLNLIQEKFDSGNFPPDLKAQIIAELKALGDVKLFVRSTSSVEDQVGFSGAGMLDTFGPMNNDVTVVLQKIKEVMYSLWKKEAFMIRRAYGIKGREHLKAKTAVMVQKAVDAVYSGLISTHHGGDEKEIEITIDEKARGGVQDTVEGRVAPLIIYNRKSGKIERLFENHPLFREDNTIGIADLFQFIRTAGHNIPDETALEIVRATIQVTKEEGLVQRISQILRQSAISGLEDGDIERLATELKVKLKEVNEKQKREIFNKLFEMGSQMEKLFLAFPLLIEYAFQRKEDGTLEVVPLQVKLQKQEAPSRISFKVKVFNRYGIHGRPSTNLVRLFENSPLFKENQVLMQSETLGSLGIIFPAVPTTFDFLRVAVPQGDVIKVVVLGKDLFDREGQVKKEFRDEILKLRKFFLNLCTDLDEDEIENARKHPQKWEEVEEIFGSYYAGPEEEDSQPTPWGDMEELRRIYNEVYRGVEVESPEPELEAAI